MLKGMLGSTIPRALRTAAIVVGFTLVVQYYLRSFQETTGPLLTQEGNPGTGEGGHGQLEHEQAHEEQPSQTNATVWDVLKSDPRVSRFADMVAMFEDIVQGLSAPKAKFTVYAPINEAVANAFVPHDPPWFYWKYLVGYHMGPGALSEKALANTATVSSFVHADIFFTYQQRISTQNDLHASANGKITFNHKATHIASAPDSACVNGFVHLIDGLLELPDSTASILRQRPSLATFHRGLILSGLSDVVNDTNKHVGQTLFAPTNVAFDHLGPKVKRFLFSPWGRPYLEALLKFHIVANHTLFSDVYFPHGGADMVAIAGANPKQAAPSSSSEHDKRLLQFQLPTLHSGANITARPVQSQGRSHLSVSLGQEREGSSAIKVSIPDIVVMDGVIHEIDYMLLPPTQRPHQRATGTRGLFTALRRATTSYDENIEVEDIIERLGPFLVQ
ncbi:hypothetical protein QQS21_000003 [Conoideocrella luteorostrata]|uniref:FAS1 domain-containing protein n=1 Tax=Conoideocrella luteorostrata TaxID=1105319 RepID=A0AAJ0D070_9HYPO|nr:hypothetical protein QQS21_000003 [Conoideocrella luteorostrata]